MGLLYNKISMIGGKMGSFNGFILTNNGRKLLEEALTGKRLIFTKFQFGDGETTEDPKEVTELVNVNKETTINQIENSGNGQVMLRVIMDNKDVETGYYVKEVGVFAKCDEGEEILYAYNKAMKPDYLPVYNGVNLVELEYQNYITIAQIEDVTAIIDGNITYLTKEEANEKFVLQTQTATLEKDGIASFKKISNYLYPVGAIYTSVDKDFNPNIIFSGEWERFGTGKTLVGVDDNDEDFKEVEKINGNKTQKLIIQNLPVHNHTANFQGNSVGAHRHLVDDHAHYVDAHTSTELDNVHNKVATWRLNDGRPGYAIGQHFVQYTLYADIPHYHRLSTWTYGSRPYTDWQGAFTPSGSVAVGNTGQNKEFDILNPSITVYFWKRVN